MLEGFQINSHILAVGGWGGNELSDPSSQVCNLCNKVTGSVSYLEDNGSFWLQRNPKRVEELWESLESKVVECVGGDPRPCWSWRDSSGVPAKSVLPCFGCEGRRGKPVSTLVDWGNTDWVSKSLVWPASWPELMIRHWPSGGFSIWKALPNV